MSVKDCDRCRYAKRQRCACIDPTELRQSRSTKENDAYDWLYQRVMGNGSVHFDSDAMEPEEPWVRYFARAMVKYASERSKR